MATINPLTEEIILAAAKETGAIVTAEEHSIIGGLGSAVAEVLAENHPTLLKRVGVHDRFGTSGKAEELLKYFSLTPEDLVEAAQEILKKKQTVLNTSRRRYASFTWRYCLSEGSCRKRGPSDVTQR